MDLKKAEQQQPKKGPFKGRQELSSRAWLHMTMLKITLLITVAPTLLFQLLSVITLF